MHAAQVVNGDYSRFDAVVDLDLDGDPDFAGSWWINAQPNQTIAEWYRNAGQGVPAGPGIRLASWNTTSNYSNGVHFVVADFDGDQHDDMIMVGLDQLLPLLSRTGNPDVRAASPFSFTNVTHARAGDVTGDGVPEVIVRDGSRVKVFEFDRGTSALQEIANMFTMQGGLALANYDQTPALEICLTTSVWLFAYALDASNTLTPVGIVANSLGAAALVVAGDIDGDQDEDIVLFQNTTVRPYYVVLRNNGATLVPEPPALGGPATNFADIDGDGDLDGLCCGGSGVYPSLNEAPATFRVSLNDGAGGFADAFPIAGMGARHLAGAVDVDADGDLDLVAGRCIVFNRGRVEDLMQPNGIPSHRSARLSDLEGDGDLDYAPGAADAATGAFLNRGDGVAFYQYRGPGLPVGTTRRALLSGDFTGDGRLDVLAEDIVGGAYQVVLIPNEFGSFPWSQPAAAPGTRFSQTSTYVYGNGVSYENHWHVVGDWDGDDDEDCAIVDEYSGWSRLWRNDGNGYFTAGPTLPAGTMVLGFGDLNGDAQVDLVVGAMGDIDQVGWLRGSAGGASFDSYQAWSARRDELPGIIDIDGDGDLDVFTSTTSGGQLLRNLGTGNFVPEPIYFDVNRHVQWRFADLNGDGRLDVICHPKYEETTRIALQSSTGGFAPITVVGRAGVPGDLDGDGDIDITGSPLMRNITPTNQGLGTTDQRFGSKQGFGGIFAHLSNVGRRAPGALVEERIVGVRGGSIGTLFFGFATTFLEPPAFPGIQLLVEPVFSIPITVSGPAGVAGVGRSSTFWRPPSVAGGLTLYTQAFFIDGSTASGGLVQTNPTCTTYPE